MIGVCPRKPLRIKQVEAFQIAHKRKKRIIIKIDKILGLNICSLYFEGRLVFLVGRRICYVRVDYREIKWVY